MNRILRARTWSAQWLWGLFYETFCCRSFERRPELMCAVCLQNCGSHSKTGALGVYFVLCKMIFSDGISYHCNTNTLLEMDVPSVLSDSGCNLSVYS